MVQEQKNVAQSTEKTESLAVSHYNAKEKFLEASGGQDCSQLPLRDQFNEIFEILGKKGERSLSLVKTSNAIPKCYDYDNDLLYPLNPTEDKAKWGKDKNDNLIYHWGKPINMGFEKLKDYSEEGKNILFYPNYVPLEVGEPCGIGAAFVKESNVFFTESDGETIEAQWERSSELYLKLGLLPSYTIFSGKKSLHDFFVTDRFVDKETWMRIQKKLIIVRWSDASSADFSKEMRCAGFLRKSTGHFQTLEFKSDRVYSPEELEAILDSTGYFPNGMSKELFTNWRRAKTEEEGLEILATPLPEKKKHKQKTGKSQKSQQKKNNASNADELTLPQKDISVYLGHILSKEVESLIKEGSEEGTRNEKAGQIALEIADTIKELEALGQPYDNDPVDILINYHLNCNYEYDEAEKRSQEHWNNCRGNGNGLTETALGWLHIRIKNHIFSLMKTQKQDELIDDPYRIPKGTALDTFAAKKIFEDDNWIVKKGVFRLYQEKEGYWKVQHEGDVATQIMYYLALFYEQENEESPKNYKFGLSKNTWSVLDCASLRLNQRNFEFSQEHIAFKNGTLNIKDGTFTDHCKEHYAVRYLDYDYKEGCECPPHFWAFLISSYGENQIKMIQALILMYISPSFPYGKFGYLTGESGSGKGILLRLIQKLLGGMAKAQGKLSVFMIEEKVHSILHDASLIVIPDCGGFAKDLYAFYELVDNGPWTGRARFSNFSYSKQWDVRFLIASVSPLHTENAEGGLKRRAIHIPTKGAPAKSDIDLEDKIASEIPEIISWVLSMDLKEAKELLFNSDKWSDEAKAQQLEQEIASDSVLAFVDGCLKPDNNRLNVQSLYEYYTAFCKASGVKAKAFTKFKNTLKHSLKPCFEDSQVKYCPDTKKSTRYPQSLTGVKLQSIFPKNPLDNTPECRLGDMETGNLVKILKP